MSHTFGDGQNIRAPGGGKSPLYFHHVLTKNVQLCGTHCSVSQNLSHPPIGNNPSRVVLQTSEKAAARSLILTHRPLIEIGVATASPDQRLENGRLGWESALAWRAILTGQGVMTNPSDAFASVSL